MDFTGQEDGENATARGTDRPRVRRHVNWRGGPHVLRRQKRAPDSPLVKPLQKMLNFPLANTEGIFYREELVLLLCFLFNWLLLIPDGI